MKKLFLFLFKPKVYYIYKALKFIYKLSKNIIMDKGFISRKLARQMGRKLDELVDFKKFGLVGKIAELVDNHIFAGAINFLDNKFGEKVPQEARKAILCLFESFVSGNYENCTEEAIAALNYYIDLPLLDEDAEYELFKGVIAMGVKLIKREVKS